VRPHLQLLWPPYHDVENHADDEAHAEAVEALRRERGEQTACIALTKPREKEAERWARAYSPPPALPTHLFLCQTTHLVHLVHHAGALGLNAHLQEGSGYGRVSPRASRLQLGRKPSAWLRTSSLTLSNAAGILATPRKERAKGKSALGVARQGKGRRVTAKRACKLPCQSSYMKQVRRLRVHAPTDRIREGKLSSPAFQRGAASDPSRGAAHPAARWRQRGVERALSWCGALFSSVSLWCDGTQRAR